MKPIDEAFDNGERPINIEFSNLVWLDKNTSKVIHSDSRAEISFLIEEAEYRSLFIKLPKGFDGKIETNGEIAHAVVIQGELSYTMPMTKTQQYLDLGSYFGSSNKSTHRVKNTSNLETILYVRTNGDVTVH